MADQAGASLAGRDYFHGNRSIYNFDRFDQRRNGRIWRRIVDTDNGLCAGSRRTGRDPLWGIIVVRNLLGIEYLMLKKSRSEEIPFVPFLLIGYLGGIFL